MWKKVLEHAIFLARPAVIELKYLVDEIWLDWGSGTPVCQEKIGAHHNSSAGVPGHVSGLTRSICRSCCEIWMIIRNANCLVAIIRSFVAEPFGN
jgi:hypothetical protein